MQFGLISIKFKIYQVSIQNSTLFHETKDYAFYGARIYCAV